MKTSFPGRPELAARVSCLAALICWATTSAFAAADLWIRDDINDVGNEPNNQSAILYLSDDIWVRRLADPNYDPHPFPISSPTWTPLPHEGPCYRDPKTSSPNYMYVRIRNRGNATSSGTETLHVYWAKASTGLNWPGDWNDHLANPCGGPLKLYGYEITKPRSNAANVSVSVRNEYVNAITNIDTSSFQFPDGLSYFDKQNAVHYNLFNAGIHSSLRFLPWHREFLARYEALLREVKPSLTLLYWDWLTDPNPTIIGPSGYMGASSGIVGAPFSTFGLSRAKPAGAPGSTYLQSAYQSGTLLPYTTFANFWGNNTLVSGIEHTSHDNAHCYLGGTMCNQNAASDPIFFMLHANCDRLWAMWQRTNINRWTPFQAYDASQGAAAITSDLRPWDGTDGFSPWQNQLPGDPNGYVIHKTPTNHSIVFPPIYDDVLLKIPPIGANQACIIEIPFYPPPLAECGSFLDPQHLCLLARIEPVGLPAETSALWQNVKDHNNIAWRNVALSDCNVGPFFSLFTGRIGAAGELIRNFRDQPAAVTLRFQETQAGFRSLFEYGPVRLHLEDNLYQAWVRGGKQGQGVEEQPVAGEVLVYTKGAYLGNLLLDKREVGHMDVALELNRNYPEPFGDVYHLEILQYDDQGGQDPVGGQRYDLDFNLLKLLPKGSDWKFLDAGQVPSNNWNLLTYDDKAWRTGSAPFGYDHSDVATILRGTNGQPPTAYFRQQFYVSDPSFYRSLALNLIQDDGVVIYLNGQEIARLNMPTGPITPSTRANVAIFGAAARACRSVRVDNALGLLKTGPNILAAELHPAPATANYHDLTFDTELAGNLPSTPYLPPEVGILTPPNGGLYRSGASIPIVADVFDPDGDLAEVRIYADGVLLSRSSNVPPTISLPAPALGSHRISVEASDTFGHLARMESVFTIISNLLPTVTVVSPINRTFPPGAPVMVVADAFDLDGSIQDVRFYVRQHLRFDAAQIFIGSDQTSPYTATVANLPPGRYMATATATDNEGAQGFSLVGHFTIAAPAGSPDITIRYEKLVGSQVATIEWDKTNGVLERATKVLGPWSPLPQAYSPYPVDASPPMEFYRLKFP